MGRRGMIAVAAALSASCAAPQGTPAPGPAAANPAAFWVLPYLHPDLANAAFPEQGGHVVAPEAGAGTQGHGLLGPSTEPFYADAVHGSTPSEGNGPWQMPARLLRGSGVPDGCRGGLAGPADSRSWIWRNRRPAPAPSKHTRA